MSEEYVDRIERCAARPSLEVTARIAKCLDVSLDHRAGTDHPEDEMPKFVEAERVVAAMNGFRGSVHAALDAIATAGREPTGADVLLACDVPLVERARDKIERAKAQLSAAESRLSVWDECSFPQCPGCPPGACLFG